MKTRLRSEMALPLLVRRALGWSLFVAGWLLLFSLSPAAAAKTQGDVLLVGVHRNFPPQYALDPESGRPAGFAVETMEAVAKRANLKVRYLVFDEWPPLNEALRNGQIDVIPNIGITEERSDLLFTIPVEAFHITMFVRETTTDLKMLDDLAGRRVAVVQDNKGLFIIQQFGKAQPVTFRSLDEALLSLLSGDTDALVYPEPPVWQIAGKSGLAARIKTAGKPLLEVKRAMAVAEGNHDLRARLNDALHELLPTAEYRNIYSRWHGAPAPYWNARRVLVAAGIVVALLTVLFAVWHLRSLTRVNRELKRSAAEQKKAEEAIRRSEELFKAIASSTPDHLIVQDSDLRYRFVMNPQLGLTEEEMIGRSDHDFLPGPDADRLTEMKREVLETGRPVHVEMPLTNRNGETQFYNGSYVPKCDAEGRVDGLIGYFRNVTDRRRVETALRALSARNEAILSAVPEIIMEVDNDKIYTWANQAGIAFFGEEVIGRAAAFYFEGEQETYDDVQPLFNGAEEMIYIESWQRRSDGAKRLLAWRCRVLRDGGGKATGAISSARDITDARQAEEKIRSLARFPSENPSPVLRLDRDGVILYANSASRPLLQEWGCSVGEEAPPFWRQAVAESLGDRANRTVDIACGKNELAVVIAPIVEAGYVNLYGRDVTERKRAEEELRISEEKFRKAFYTSPDAININRLEDGLYVSINRGFTQTTGYTEEDIIGRSSLEVDIWENPEERKRLAAGLMKDGEVRNLEVRFRIKSGNTIDALMSAALIDLDGVPHIISITRDITERKRAEEEIRRLNAELEGRVAERTAELEAKNRELEQFTYSVSHDLKAPLRGIDGYSHLLMKDYADALDDDGKLFVTTIRTAAVSMGQLIDDLLAYSRLERRAFAATSVALRPLVEAQVAERADEAAERGVTLAVDLPDVSVTAEPEGLSQALRNLLDNAVKFTAKVAEPHIEIGGRDEGRSVLLWVRDNGIGFDMKYHDRIFQIFQRLHAEDEYPGTGIGMAIVQKTMQRMHGRAWAESAPGEGATFFLEVPK